MNQLILRLTKAVLHTCTDFAPFAYLEFHSLWNQWKNYGERKSVLELKLWCKRVHSFILLCLSLFYLLAAEILSFVASVFKYTVLKQLNMTSQYSHVFRLVTRFTV